MPNHRETINNVKAGFEANTSMKQFVNRVLTEIDPEVIKQLSVVFCSTLF